MEQKMHDSTWDLILVLHSRRVYPPSLFVWQIPRRSIKPSFYSTDLIATSQTFPISQSRLREVGHPSKDPWLLPLIQSKCPGRFLYICGFTSWPCCSVMQTSDQRMIPATAQEMVSSDRSNTLGRQYKSPILRLFGIHSQDIQF